MSAINGPRLERIKKEVEEWYFRKREMLIAAMEEEYPYGAVRLEPTEQFQRFMTMTPEDWLNVVVQLQNRYRGDPEMHDKVSNEISSYVQSMLSLAEEQPEGVTNASTARE